MAYPQLPPAPCGLLPPALRVLSVSAEPGDSWSAESLAEDSAVELTLTHAAGAARGLVALREQLFDAAIITHNPPHLDAFGLLDAILAGHGDELPLLVAGHASELEMSALCYEAGADAYLCFAHTSTRALFWHLARAVERRRLISANRQYEQQARNRLAKEHCEADRLLTQQRQLIGGLEAVSDSTGLSAAADARTGQRETIQQRYRELLQTAVMKGPAALENAIPALAQELVDSGATAAQAMTMHLAVLEQMVDGLGTLSARHVITRGDLLILELMTNLAGAYREISQPDHGDPAGDPQSAPLRYAS